MPQNFYHILLFCALRGGVPNTIVLLLKSKYLAPQNFGLAMHGTACLKVTVACMWRLAWDNWRPWRFISPFCVQCDVSENVDLRISRLVLESNGMWNTSLSEKDCSVLLKKPPEVPLYHCMKNLQPLCPCGGIWRAIGQNCLWDAQGRVKVEWGPWLKLKGALSKYIYISAFLRKILGTQCGPDTRIHWNIPIFSDSRNPMIIFFDSRDPIFNSRDPNWVPKTP